MISEQKDGSIWISVYVQPGASRSEIVGLFNGSLKIRIQSPPVDGKANEALIEFLVKTLDLSKKSISLVRGETQRTKVVRITDLSLSEIRSKLHLL